MQGRRTFLVLDEWLSRFVSSAWLRFALMALGLVALNVVFIAAAAGLVELLTWLLGPG